MQDHTKIECNRCGLCCEAFALPFVHEYLELGEQAIGALFQLSDITIRGGEHKGKTLLEFIKPISYKAAEKTGLNPLAFARFSIRTKAFYACSLFERDKDGLGSCSIHKFRPAFCRNYRPKIDPDAGTLVAAEQIIQEACSYLDFFKSL